MIYNLTEKLKFDQDPVLVIRDTELTIRSDAETVLKLMDLYQTKGEMAAAADAVKLLLSEKDQKKLSTLKLKMGDYMEVIKAMAQLAMGADPDEENAGE